MDKKEILSVIGDLYIQLYMLQQEMEKKNQEVESLKGIILSLQNNKNGTVSQGLSCQKNSG